MAALRSSGGAVHRRSLRIWGALALLVVAVVLTHLALLRSTVRRPLHGDEILYYRQAHRYSRLELTSVLPGRLEFGHRTALYSHLLSNLVNGESELMEPVSLPDSRRGGRWGTR